MYLRTINMIGNYKEDVKIDPENLENEWMEQPSLFLYYAEAHADAMHEKDMAKSRLDLCYARMYADIKKNWSNHFESKPTEPALKEYIYKSSKYQKAERTLIDAVKSANVMLGAKTAFDHRKRALENLVSLRISGFHSEPRSKSRTVKTGGSHKVQKSNLNDGAVQSRISKRKRRS